MNFQEIPCICCGNIIEGINYDDEINVTTMWSGGEVTKISYGYGSKLDGDVFYIGICDRCIIDKTDNGNAYYAHNYMGQNHLDSERNERWNGIQQSAIRETTINKIIK